MLDLREAAQRVVDNATPATEPGANYFVWKHQLDHLRDALASPPPVPCYDALLLIAQSVCGALERAGVTECDDPGEAIDVLRERWEKTAHKLACEVPLPEVRHRIIQWPMPKTLPRPEGEAMPAQYFDGYSRDELIAYGDAREAAAAAAHERAILKVIDERDHLEGIIDRILDAVLGSDRPEWSSAYGYEDAVIEVIDKLPPAQAIQPAADGDMVLIERGLIGAACHAIEKKRDAPNLLAKLRAVTMAAGRADAVPALDSVLRERGLPTVADALGYSRNFAAANPALSQTTRDHIEGLCNMLEIAANHPAPAPQPMTTQGEAAQVPRDSVPEGFAIVPRELTAENGAKAEFMGETFGGDAVSWTAIKAVHRAVVKWAEDARHG